ncbi:MAG: dTMP kinase [Hyphomicrobiales bacterium]|nr:dTMP kinase [Hyphomicrobiales bacterium]
MNAARSGRFITFEGGEGAGKTTQMAMLARRLEALGLAVVTTREPGGSPRAEILRAALLSGKFAAIGPEGEAILFNAARIDHIDTKIAPALARGDWVLCDRFADSTRAYQGVAGKASPRLIEELERVSVGDMRPDLTLLLDIAPEIGLARAQARSGAFDRFESEAIHFHRALRRAFLDIAAREPQRIVVVDAEASPEEMSDFIWRAVQQRLAPRRERA